MYASTSPSDAVRLAFLAAVASPLARRSSAARSRSPPACCSAARQSMTPAPVRFRNSLTRSVLISTAVLRFTRRHPCSSYRIRVSPLRLSFDEHFLDRRLDLHELLSLRHLRGARGFALHRRHLFGPRGRTLLDPFALAPLFHPFEGRIGDRAVVQQH